MARAFFALVLFVSALSSATAAEICYLGDAAPQSGGCKGLTLPARICDGGLGLGEAQMTAMALTMESVTTEQCESTMTSRCPSITAAATGKTGSDACAGVCMTSSMCNTGKLTDPPSQPPATDCSSAHCQEHESDASSTHYSNVTL
ncbi:hypothetical protein T484DRAFT_3630470 [Baffinella frigidus]|nr:hypothetical protein T484DRAFT_3630470 [Cryptophyta sp. CCMP2293]